MIGNMKVTIIGSGSTGMATAAYLISKGVAVTICDEQTEDFPAIEKQGGIIARGNAMRGTFRPDALTDNFEEAIRSADTVIVCTSTGRHPNITDRCAAYAAAGQLFLFNPGNLGALMLRQKLERAGIRGVLCADTSGSFWACRRTGAGEVVVAMPLNAAKPVAASPAADTPAALERLAPLFPVCSAANVFEAALNSPNVVSHVGGAILNAIPIERAGKDYVFYLHGLGEPVFTLNEGLERERNAVMEALGLKVYKPSGNGFMRMIMDRSSHPELDCFRSLDGPSSFAHRYVSEDAACGVSLLIALAQLVGISVPLTTATAVIAGCLNSTDYIANGYSPAYFGLEGSAEEILAAI